MRIVNDLMFYFRANMLIWIDIGERYDKSFLLLWIYYP